jgi:hypothetical protein
MTRLEASLAANIGQSNNEANLLQIIEHIIPEEIQERYDHLTQKKLGSDLRPEERSELLALIDEIELLDARRIKAMIQLASFRGISLRALKQQMGIQPKAYA